MTGEVKSPPRLRTTKGNNNETKDVAQGRGGDAAGGSKARRGGVQATRRLARASGGGATLERHGSKRCGCESITNGATAGNERAAQREGLRSRGKRGGASNATTGKERAAREQRESGATARDK